jgi:hypothetical protein
MEPKSKSSLGIHFFYVTLILVLTIVVLVTHRWTQIEQFRDYLNVGATVTSLVLGVLAIIYAFVSSGQQSSVLGAVEAAAVSTGSSVAKLDTFMTTAQQLQAEASKRSGDLHALTHSLAASVDQIKQETIALVAANREVAGKVSLLPDQLGEMLAGSGKAASPAPAALGTSEALWNLDAISASLSGTSIYGLACIEACLRAHEYGKNLSIDKLAAHTGQPIDLGYFWGYALGFATSRLITITPHQQDIHQFHVMSVHPRLGEALLKEWARREQLPNTAEGKEMQAKVRGASLVALTDPAVPAPSTSPTAASSPSEGIVEKPL